MKKKTIAIVTSTRADYNYFRLIIKKIIDSETLNLTLLVTGMHLLRKYGDTVEVIRKDNVPITEIVEMYDENDDSISELGKAVGKGIINFTSVLAELKPDIMLVLGDRYEPLAAVIAASTLLIPIAHIHGGDHNHSGQIDEQIRHSITKFAHLHFCATKKSAERIKLLGEEEWRIKMVGSPSIDHFYQDKFLNRLEISKKLAINPNDKIIVCLQHSYTMEPNKAGDHIKLTFNVLRDLNLQTVVIYPNNDPGSNLIIEEIIKVQNHPQFKIYKNLDYFDFYSLLSNADLLIGNSSAGIIESSIFKLPVVNIGNRNKGRESAENVINVIHDFDMIKNAIERGLSENFKLICSKVDNPYGNGTASERIVKILEELEINKKLLIKRLTYTV